MNKLLVVSVLVALLAINTEGFRVVRQAQEEEQGSLSKVANTVQSYYNSAVDATSGYIEKIKELKLNERATDLYKHVAEVVSTYAGIAQDQAYHRLYLQQ